MALKPLFRDYAWGISKGDFRVGILRPRDLSVLQVSCVGKLCLPPGGRYLGCRTCHDLTYESCHMNDKRVSWFMRNEVAVMAMLEFSAIVEVGPKYCRIVRDGRASGSPNCADCYHGGRYLLRIIRLGRICTLEVTRGAMWWKGKLKGPPNLGEKRKDVRSSNPKGSGWTI